MLCSLKIFLKVTVIVRRCLNILFSPFKEFPSLLSNSSNLYLRSILSIRSKKINSFGSATKENYLWHNNVLQSLFSYKAITLLYPSKVNSTFALAFFCEKMKVSVPFYMVLKLVKRSRLRFGCIKRNSNFNYHLRD